MHQYAFNFLTTLKSHNAHVGELSEVSDAHAGFVLDCPEVLETRRNVCNSVNKAGQLLVDLAAATSMAITTGRVVGDDGQPSLTGNYGDKRAGLITCCCLRLCTNLCVRLRCGIRVLLIMRL